VDEPDWYCSEVLAGRVDFEAVVETDDVLAFRPPVPGFGADHVIVITKRHVRSLLDCDGEIAGRLLDVLKMVAAEVVERHGGCRYCPVSETSSTTSSCISMLPPETASPASSRTRSCLLTSGCVWSIRPHDLRHSLGAITPAVRPVLGEGVLVDSRGCDETTAPASTERRPSEETSSSTD
jgi:histidine triad (HIT) family protein